MRFEQGSVLISHTEALVTSLEPGSVTEHTQVLDVK